MEVAPDLLPPLAVVAVLGWCSSGYLMEQHGMVANWYQQVLLSVPSDSGRLEVQLSDVKIGVPWLELL